MLALLQQEGGVMVHDCIYWCVMVASPFGSHLVSVLDRVVRAVAVHSGISQLNDNGLRTQPCGAPVLAEMVLTV